MRESILAIELSQRAGSIALRPRVDADVVEMAVPPSDDANDHLMAAIDELCRAQRVAPHDLAAINRVNRRVGRKIQRRVSRQRPAARLRPRATTTASDRSCGKLGTFLG